MQFGRQEFSDYQSFLEYFADEAALANISVVDSGMGAFLSQRRMLFTAKYAQKHYGFNSWQLTDPQAIILHATSGESLSHVLDIFSGVTIKGRRDIAGNGTDSLNVSSHFIVDRDGTIHLFAPVDFICRHAIGYNWTALGIEVVSSERLSFSPDQVHSCAWLIPFLKKEISSVRWVFPHHCYQQGEYTELIRSYSDPEYVPQNFPRFDPYGNDFHRVISRL